jgi:hypothetical protein
MKQYNISKFYLELLNMRGAGESEFLQRLQRTQKNGKKVTRTRVGGGA